MNNIGLQIKKAREEKGWTQDELAKRMGYKSKSTINKIELGINDVTQSKIIKFSEVLDVSVLYLMEWNQEDIDASADTQNDVVNYIELNEKMLKDFMTEISEMGFSSSEINRIRDYAHIVKQVEGESDDLHIAYIELFKNMYELGLDIKDLAEIYKYAKYVISNHDT